MAVIKYKIEENRCKKHVLSRGLAFGHYHQCTRRIWKDGFCKQHHPDVEVKRKEEAQRRYEEKQQRSPLTLLQKQREEIESKNDEIRRLREEIVWHHEDFKTQNSAICKLQDEVKDWKHRAVGGTCEMLSKGDACTCGLCRRDTEIEQLKKQIEALERELDRARRR